MKPFALDTVLSYRQRLEDIAKNNLAQARIAEHDVSLKLTHKKNSYNELIHLIERVQLQGIGILDLISHEEHLEFVKVEIVEIEKELEKKKEHVVLTRKELIKKARERQVLEKLKEQQNADWKHYLNKKEAAMLDEIAIIYHQK